MQCEAVTTGLRVGTQSGPKARAGRSTSAWLAHKANIGAPRASDEALLARVDDITAVLFGLMLRVQRSRTLEALVEQLLGLAQQKPVLVVIEDVHWIDPSTLEFVQLVLDRIEGRRVLVLLTSRPDGQPVLAGHPHVTRLVLNRLGRVAVEAMTDAIEGSAALPDAVRREIVARTDGVPLFVEELTRALVELAEQSHKDGSSDVELHASDLNVPATLHDSLMSRLDRLPELKRVAQIWLQGDSKLAERSRQPFGQPVPIGDMDREGLL